MRLARFADNVLRQPAYRDITSRVPEDLTNSARVMNGTFLVGVYSRLTDEMIDFVVQQSDDLFASASG